MLFVVTIRKTTQKDHLFCKRGDIAKKKNIWYSRKTHAIIFIFTLDTVEDMFALKVRQAAF